LLGDDEPELRQRAAGVLLTLAENDENKRTLVWAGAIPPLVALLTDDSPQVRKNASGALLKLSFIRKYSFWS
jgi:vesicle coat complex subunit